MENSSSKDEAMYMRLFVLIFILTGLLLIAVSIALPNIGIGGYLRELLKELGIVILSVFTISALYELLVAKKYLNQFIALLRKQFEQGENNAAACANLGITEIFSRRDFYELKYPFVSLLSGLVGSAHLRIVARSLFLTMTKPRAIKEAIQGGARVDLCIYDPTSSPEQIAKSPDLVPSELQTTIALFRKEIVEWVRAALPSGSVRLRFHQIPLLDSCFLLNSPNQQICVWDLSFGRDLASKRILVLDRTKLLGADISGRYDRVWEDASTAFEYDGHSIIVDKLSSARAQDAT